VLQDRDPDDDRPVVLLAQDEGRFGRINSVQRAWAPAGIRPRVARQIVRESLYAFVAVAPALGKLTALILPKANTAMMNRFLAQVAADFADYFVVMQVDGAGWHRSKDLQIPDNIRLIEQPAASPELNPVEHIWDDIREKAMPNRMFETLERVEQALEQGIQRLAALPEKLRSMTFFPHLRIEI
jgi:hypothetical protein